MKRIILTIALMVPALSYAQNLTDAQKTALEAAQTINNTPEAAKKIEKPNYWKMGMSVDLGFNQTALANWAAGGYGTVTLAAGLDAHANYAKGLMTWNNRAQLNYGFLWSADKPDLLQKSNDRIYLESKWAYKAADKSKWNYAASFDFRSQFTNSYDSYDKGEDGKWFGKLKSGFFSPAYTNIALGMDWAPVDWFDMNIAPVTGGFIVVANEALRETYGMKLKAGEDSIYNPAKFQFGAQVKTNFRFAFNDKLKYDTQLVVFTDYLENAFRDYRVNWDNNVSWNATKFFKVGFQTWMIYDPTIKFAKVVDGNEISVKKVQFKEFFSISFTYTIANKK